MAARDMEYIDRDYKRLWRKENKLISQFFLLPPKVGVDPMRSLTRSPYVSIETVPLPLAVKDFIPMLALPAPRTDPHIEEVEHRIGATQLGFQEAC